MTDKAPNAILVRPGEVVSETYIVKYFESENEANSFLSFVNTNIFRFLFNCARYSHNTTRASYVFIPELTWDKTYFDHDLMILFGLSENEMKKIFSQIGEDYE